MALGPGKYDDLVSEIMERTKADGIILAVFGGEGGDGFEAQLPFPLTERIPDILRAMADEIEKTGGSLAGGL